MLRVGVSKYFKETFAQIENLKIVDGVSINSVFET